MKYMIDFKKELPGLEEEWNKIKHNVKRASYVEEAFQDLKVIIKKSSEEGSFQEVVNQKEATDCYIRIRSAINKGEVQYSLLALSTGKDQLIPLFLEFADDFSDKEYWKNLASAYMMLDHCKIDYDIFRGLFSADRKNREYLMEKEDRAYLASLPEKIRIFRGGSMIEEKEKKYGVSWTLNRDTAEQFAFKKKRPDKEMIVMEKYISKQDIIAYFNERKEEEIIYFEEKYQE